MMKNTNQSIPVTHLKCREIQAPLVSLIINGFEEEFGNERTVSIVKKIIGKDAANSGKSLAGKFNGNSLIELLKVVKEVWAQDDAMEIKNLVLSDNSLKFDVTRCRYSEMYEKLGLKELGIILSCNRDFDFVEGFNPGLKLVRDKTIMQGDDICNFCYSPKQ